MKFSKNEYKRKNTDLYAIDKTLKKSKQWEAERKLD